MSLEEQGETAPGPQGGPGHGIRHLAIKYIKAGLCGYQKAVKRPVVQPAGGQTALIARRALTGHVAQARRLNRQSHGLVCVVWHAAWSRPVTRPGQACGPCVQGVLTVWVLGPVYGYMGLGTAGQGRTMAWARQGRWAL